MIALPGMAGRRLIGGLEAGQRNGICSYDGL